MAISTIDESQRKAATVVGAAYLLALPPAVFAEAVATVPNIVAHERLFRLGTAANVGVFALDIVLITALYVVLKPVNRHLALLAAFWGLIETAVLAVVTVSDLGALRVLSGTDDLRAFETDRLQALATLSMGAHRAAYQVGLVFAGLRSTVFGYLWFRSNFIPRTLAAWGMFSSLTLATCAYAFIVFPDLAKTVTVAYYGGPIFIFELTMGFWLLGKGLRSSEVAGPIDRTPAGSA